VQIPHKTKGKKGMVENQQMMKVRVRVNISKDKLKVRVNIIVKVKMEKKNIWEVKIT
jgi:hypothetical protein